MAKNLPAMRETAVWFLGQEDPLEKGMATHSSILAWRIPWTEEPGRLQFKELQRVRHNWVTNTFTSFDVKGEQSTFTVSEFKEEWDRKYKWRNQVTTTAKHESGQVSKHKWKKDSQQSGHCVTPELLSAHQSLCCNWDIVVFMRYGWATSAIFSPGFP